ncbi:PhzF family phenazine biosynthesis protein [Simiduia aestuariiviva]|uniref:PhzF family phenazine biosynthesis protein n=1 Tax=Simiduia aestuariiviva TaxID=1510459 RepID=A0A839UVB2_9GAMM|nr:PhzF family phenazine biosynthesis protein [Simiduia aestuariiviva]MBB3169976.1 PhzF family phenazine biosynthesis protein [Simiduia aestuariiviva]
MKISVAQVNAFTDQNRGGNPAGVVLNADHLTYDQKLAIAHAAKLSETAFVSRSAVADVKLEFFTPTRQIPHCGHATIATFRYLREQELLGEGDFTKETIDGTRRVLLRGDEAYMEQRSPKFTAIDAHLASTLQSLGIDAGQTIAAPMRVDTGNGFLVLGLSDTRWLAELKPDLTAIKALSESLNLVGFYLFSSDTVVAGRHATTRMFAPRFGIDEEAATGMAAGPLACYLSQQLGQPDTEFFIEQGQFMTPASPSIIQVQLEKQGSEIHSLMAGGNAQFVRQIDLEI